MYEMERDTRPTFSYLFNLIKVKAAQSHGGDHSPHHRAAGWLWMPNLGEKLMARPTFMSLEGCDHWTGILLQLQQGDLSRVIANEGMLSIQIIPEKQSRTDDRNHLSTFPHSHRASNSSHRQRLHTELRHSMTMTTNLKQRRERWVNSKQVRHMLKEKLKQL